VASEIAQTLLISRDSRDSLDEVTVSPVRRFGATVLASDLFVNSACGEEMVKGVVRGVALNLTGLIAIDFVK
jgi:hypothetical protein